MIMMETRTQKMMMGTRNLREHAEMENWNEKKEVVMVMTMMVPH